MHRLNAANAGMAALGAGLLLAIIVAAAHAQTFSSASDEEFLPPDEAFRMSVVRGDAGFVARWTIADQYYLYRDKFRFRSAHGDITARVPPGERMRDEFFGETDVFRHYVEVPFEPRFAVANDTAMMTLGYQGCADAGLCYPPITRQVNLARVSLAEAGSAASGSPPTQAPVSQQFRVLEHLKSGGLLPIIAAFFGFGLLLAFTPCILPMIPILSGVIARSSDREHLASGATFAMSLSYVLAMAVTYSLLGVAVGLSGEALQAWFQQPWVLGSFAGVFVLLALSMFGFYNLQMPAAVQTRLLGWSGRGAGRKPALVNAAVMGCVSALIVGPCTTAPLIGVLLFIAQTGDAMVGGTALFFLALGIGMPLLIVGASLGSLLPRPGPMLDAVKVFFGLLLLAVAVWLLDRIAPAGVIVFLSGALLMFTAAYLYQVAKGSTMEFGGNTLTLGFAAVFLLYGALLIAGAATGGSNLLRPLAHFATASAPVRQHALDFRPVQSLAQLEHEIALAEQSGRGVMLDFYADWCVTCKEMELLTFSDPEVQSALADLVLLQADVTENNDDDRALLKHLGLFGPPAILFFDDNGYEFGTARVVGYMNSGDFVQHLEQIYRTRKT